MKSIEIYKDYKRQIGELADGLGFNDKPARRMVLNDNLDAIIREINSGFVLNETITEKRGNQFINWLTDYTIKRHDK